MKEFKERDTLECSSQVVKELKETTRTRTELVKTDTTSSSLKPVFFFLTLLFSRCLLCKKIPKKNPTARAFVRWIYLTTVRTRLWGTWAYMWCGILTPHVHVPHFHIHKDFLLIVRLSYQLDTLRPWCLSTKPYQQRPLINKTLSTETTYQQVWDTPWLRGGNRNTHYPGKWIVSVSVRTDHPVQLLLYLSISKPYQTIINRPSSISTWLISGWSYQQLVDQ